ncbi:MAG: exodeoxyribonuclease VII small subunit [Bacteroidia bacterium]|jgi:exodeoxyribonuclease VII small subunit
MKNEKLNYTDAYEELIGIVNDLEEGEISVDELTEKIKRASELIQFCKGILRKTELDVDQILEEIKNSETTKEED